MRLGTYVEILNYVDDTSAAGAYYPRPARAGRRQQRCLQF